MQAMTRPEAVNDPSLIVHIKKIVEQVVSDPFNIKPEAAGSRGWVVVPVERGRHLERAEAAVLSSALQHRGITHCYALLLQLIQGDPECFRVGAGADGLFAFSQEYSVVAAALVPEDASFLILFTVDEYSLYAGPASFVEAALGKSIEEARADFDIFAGDPCWKGRLASVASRYRNL